MNWRVICVLLAVSGANRLSASMDGSTLKWVQTALDAWQVACESNIRIAPAPLPWIIVYDDVDSWHINPEEALLPHHRKTSQTVRFSGWMYEISEIRNRGTVWVPGREQVTAVPPRASTMLYANESKPFFVVGMPSFQERTLRVDAREKIEFRNLLIGLMLHELSHTRQLPNVVSQIKSLQSQGKYPEKLDDNLMQRTFGRNLEFVRMFDSECRHFSAAVMARDPRIAREETEKGLDIMDRRRKRFFAGEHRGWSEMEETFLALEGPAMWVQYQSALRLAPPGLAWRYTLVTLGQRTAAWSQTEGLFLFLLIDRFCPGWQARFFDTAVISPSGVLREAMRRTAGGVGQ